MDSNLHKWTRYGWQLNLNCALPAKLFKQMHGTRIKLDFKKVILLDSQSTMDLIFDLPSPGGINFQVQSQHVTENQWWNHGSEQTGNHVRISETSVVQ
jgi:hypothetical protein